MYWLMMVNDVNFVVKLVLLVGTFVTIHAIDMMNDLI
jgi:hypothetical protein